MLIPRFNASLLSVGLIVLCTGMACGQNYPNKPIRFTTPEVGGGANFTARLVAEKLTGSLGQPVVIENRPSPTIGEAVSRANPDGYTVGIAGSPAWIPPLLQKMAYDPQRDLSPICWMSQSTNIVVVHPSVPAKTVKELIALAKAKPGGLNYASPLAGAEAHLGAELFKSMAGVNIVRVAFKGSGPALNSLVAGELQMMVSPAIAAIPLIKAGRLRGLAVTSLEPSAMVPDLPTVSASGLPGYELVNILGIFAPVATPAAIINRLNQEIVRALNQSDVKEKLFELGSEVVASTPAQFGAKMKSETVKWSKVIKDAGITAD